MTIILVLSSSFIVVLSSSRPDHHHPGLCCIRTQITHWQHPRFHAYFPAGNSYPSILADMLSDAIGCVGFSWVSLFAPFSLSALSVIVVLLNACLLYSLVYRDECLVLRTGLHHTSMLQYFVLH